MLPTPHTIHHLVPLVGMWLVLASLYGCLTLSAESASGFEPAAYRDYPYYRDYPNYQEYRPYRRPRYERPDRFTIHKGKKCQIRCERIRGTLDYRCREYRC
jgi:hypothetical protein